MREETKRLQGGLLALGILIVLGILLFCTEALFATKTAPDARKEAPAFLFDGHALNSL